MVAVHIIYCSPKLMHVCAIYTVDVSLLSSSSRARKQPWTIVLSWEIIEESIATMTRLSMSIYTYTFESYGTIAFRCALRIVFLLLAT